MIETKTISSTQAQNNFGRVLDEVALNRSRYIVKRNGVPRAIVLGFDDFSGILTEERKRRQVDEFLRELRPTYQLGETVKSSKTFRTANAGERQGQESVQYAAPSKATKLNPPRRNVKHRMGKRTSGIKAVASARTSSTGFQRSVDLGKAGA